MENDYDGIRVPRLSARTRRHIAWPTAVLLSSSLGAIHESHRPRVAHDNLDAGRTPPWKASFLPRQYGYSGLFCVASSMTQHTTITHIPSFDRRDSSRANLTPCPGRCSLLVMTSTPFEVSHTHQSRLAAIDTKHYENQTTKIARRGQGSGGRTGLQLSNQAGWI